MKSKYVFFVGLGLLALGLLIDIAGGYAFGETIGMCGGIVMLLGFPIAGIIEMIIRYPELEEKRKAKRAKISEQQKEDRVKQAELKKQWQQKEIERQKKNHIVGVKYLGSGATAQEKGGLGGAVLGGMVAGPLGAVIGASSTKNVESLHRFAVKYGDGRLEIKELHPNSWEYKELMKYVKWEDIK